MTSTKPIAQPKRFKVIYADPPWNIAQQGARGATRHYDLMSVDQLAAMPIADLADENATLLLWVTNAALPAGLEVMKTWGFDYKTNAAWDKYYMGLGNYFRGTHELLLHGVRGRAPFKFRGQRSTLLFPRTDHSTKPAEMIPLIERVLDGPYLELFARQRPNSHADWSVWGDEIESDITIPGYRGGVGRDHRRLRPARTGSLARRPWPVRALPRGPPMSRTRAFSTGRRKPLWNGQQPRESGPAEVKWEGKRRPQPMAIRASGMRPGPIDLGAPTPPQPLSQTAVSARLEAVLTPEGGHP